MQPGQRRGGTSLAGMPPFGRLLALALLLPVIAACSSAASSSAPSVSPSAQPDASSDPCAPWGCTQLARFAAATAFLSGQQGRIGIVVKDRTTGTVWRAGDETLRSWAGSTPKLALAVLLKEEARAGSVSLTPADAADIDSMLDTSDNRAADRLWGRYAGSEDDDEPVAERIRDDHRVLCGWF